MKLLRSGPSGMQLRRVMLSELISRLGTQMTALAVPWFVLISTGSISRMGLVYGAEVLPVAVLGVPAGLIVARLGSRQTVVIGDILSAGLIVLVPILHLTGLLQFWMILVIVACLGAVATPYICAQRLLLPDILGDDTAAVTSGNASLESATWIARTVGPGIAGILIATLGALNLLWIDAGSFLLSACLLFGLPRRPVLSAEESASAGALAGLRYALSNRVIRRILTVATGYGLLMPFVLLSLPVLAKLRYDANPKAAGLLLAAWGGGAALGTVAVILLARKLSPLRLGAIGGLAAALPLFFLALKSPLAVAAALIACCSLFLPLVSSPAVAVLSTYPPRALRPQVVNVFTSATQLVAPAGYAIAGLALAKFGIGPIIIPVAAGLLLCGGMQATLVRLDSPEGTRAEVETAEESGEGRSAQAPVS